MKLQLISIGITNQNNLQLYLDTVREIIKEVTVPTIFVLPEYCWGEIRIEVIDSGIKQLQEVLNSNQYLVPGSYPRRSGKLYYNTAELYDNKSKIWSIQKTHVLSDEKTKNEVEMGKNPGIIDIEGLKIAIVICADIWDNILLNDLIKKQRADLLIIPAFTVVPKGFVNYAKTQWHSLAVVRSREYLVPIIIADHHIGSEKFDVGGASCVVDPSKKETGMGGFKGFLELADNYIAKSTIDFEEIKEYRNYRIEKGLYSEKVI